MCDAKRQLISGKKPTKYGLFGRVFSTRRHSKEHEEPKNRPDEDMIRQLESIQKKLFHDQMRMRKRSIERYNRFCVNKDATERANTKDRLDKASARPLTKGEKPQPLTPKASPPSRSNSCECGRLSRRHSELPSNGSRRHSEFPSNGLICDNDSINERRHHKHGKVVQRVLRSLSDLRSECSFCDYHLTHIHSATREFLQQHDRHDRSHFVSSSVSRSVSMSEVAQYQRSQSDSACVTETYFARRTRFKKCDGCLFDDKL